MKRLFILSLVSVFAISSFAQGSTQKFPTIEIGSDIPMADEALKDVSGDMLSLTDVKGENGLLVMFSCNTCPFVIGSGSSNEGWEGRYQEIYEWCNENGIGFTMINSNEAKRDLGDSFDDMVAHSEEMGWDCHYMLDPDSKMANAFGGKTTPHAFLFNGESKLVYSGSIDDSPKSASAVAEPYLKNALGSLVSGEEISPATTTPVGCSIKRVM